MPPEFVAALYVYVVKHGRQKGDERTVLYLSMVRHVLSMAHRFSGLVDPTLEPQVRAVFVGLINDFGLKPKHPKIAIYPEEVARMILRNSSAENEPTKLFHNAVMATGSAGAMRSKEVSLLDLEHFKFDTRGVTIYISQSKTDQEQVGREIYLSRTGSASCPVRSIELYQELLPVRPGPAFRTIAYNAISPTRACTRTLRRAVQQHALLLGLSNHDVGFHSLRAGFITAAIDANMPLHKIMEVTGHKSIDSLLHYYRPRLSHDNLTQAVGL